MIIIPPTEMHCSLEPNEIKTINECITLLKGMRDTMDECDYSYLLTDYEELMNGDLTDLIRKLENLKHINSMY